VPVQNRGNKISFVYEARFIGADLRDSQFFGTNLSEADLTGAGLTGADFSGTNVTLKQLEKAKSLQGATMPDGSKHP